MSKNSVRLMAGAVAVAWRTRGEAKSVELSSVVSWLAERGAHMEPHKVRQAVRELEVAYCINTYSGRTPDNKPSFLIMDADLRCLSDL